MAEETKKEKISPSDYKIMLDLVKEVDSQYHALKGSISSQIESNFGLHGVVLEAVIPYTIDIIKEMETEDIIKFLLPFYKKGEEDLRSKSDTEIKEMMLNVKNGSILICKTKIEADDIRKESSDILKEYFEYLGSDKVRESRIKRLEALKEAAEKEEDSSKKARILDMIKTMESTMDFLFIKERFDKLGEEEVIKIKDAYFNDEKSKHIKFKFDNKIHKFGFKPSIFTYFFNIEENFLPKKYSVFNNLFLFIYMRMIAYADPYLDRDKMRVQALTGAMSKLVYHKFDNLVAEEDFVNVIKDVLDRFEKYYDEFDEKNTTHENHPYRKQLEAEHESSRKKEIINKLSRMHIPFDENLSAAELNDVYNKELDLMMRKQCEKEEEKPLEIEESEEVPVEETTEEQTESTEEN